MTPSNCFKSGYYEKFNNNCNEEEIISTYDGVLASQLPTSEPQREPLLFFFYSDIISQNGTTWFPFFPAQTLVPGSNLGIQII